MRYIWQHLQNIIDDYRGEVPLSHYLKHYFKRYPKLGSRDRKILSEMIYCSYRCKKGISADIPVEEKTGISLFLCGSQSTFIKPFIPEYLQQDMSFLSLPERIEAVRNHFDINQLFPSGTPLSSGIDTDEWLQSMLSQPKLFLRIRRDEAKINGLLTDNGIIYERVGNSCFALANGAPIDKILPPESYVVQDYSSQQTGTFFKASKNENWYDCCAGAGGKSLLLKDLEPSVKLTVTDRRESILHNLNQRFRLYGYPPPTMSATEVNNEEAIKKVLGTSRFDGIICDVPCTGSGTWARTPEQLYFFTPDKLNEIRALQTTIAVNVAAYLKPGGRLIYITCSVFRQENEDVVFSLKQQTNLSTESSTIINGNDNGADSMFVAVLKRE